MTIDSSTVIETAELSNAVDFAFNATGNSMTFLRHLHECGFMVVPIPMSIDAVVDALLAKLPTEPAPEVPKHGTWDEWYDRMANHAAPRRISNDELRDARSAYDRGEDPIKFADDLLPF